ncbi:MAG: DUF4430 domain-containing protein [Candidatus Dojkabacteria bacterium]|nr:DUF4430 domain-containing protein [Candidatus Dojkabacteria bacterium]
MGNLLGKIDFKQLRWGILAGVITVGFMALSYKVGYDRKSCNELDLLDNQTAEVTDWEVNIYVKKDCTDFVEGVGVENGKEISSFCITFEKGKTAFDYMKKLAEESEEFSFDYQESDFGIFVSSVNNYHPDVKTKFWAFLVNGEMSMVGVGDYKVVPGDRLTLELEDVEF